MQLSVTLRAFLIKNRSFIEKIDENEAESQRIETVTLFWVAQQYLLFSMLLPVLNYLIQPEVTFFWTFSVANSLSIMD